mgnify:CR=1 FL=1
MGDDLRSADEQQAGASVGALLEDAEQAGDQQPAVWLPAFRERWVAWQQVALRQAVQEQSVV